MVYSVEPGQAGRTKTIINHCKTEIGRHGVHPVELGQAYIWWTVELGQAGKTKKVSIIAKVGQADIGFIL